MNIRRLQKNIHHTVKKGFTLIEMIVVIAIITIVTAIVLFNSSRLHSAVLVSNTAYEIGLIVREAQVAGLGVRATPGTGGVQGFTSSHGIHFDLADPTKIVMFADMDDNKEFTPGEMTQEYKISNSRSGKLLDICAGNSSSFGACQGSFTGRTYEHPQIVDVVFTRPNPEAFFKKSSEGGEGMINHSGRIIINVGFPEDTCRSITIEKTGSVQVDSTCTPPEVSGSTEEPPAEQYD